MAPNQNSRKRAPLGDITNIAPRSRDNTGLPRTPSTTNCLSTSTITKEKGDLHSPDVNEWYSSCYNNMLSAPIHDSDNLRMASKHNSRERAPLGDITNTAPRSRDNLVVTNEIHNSGEDETHLYSQLSSNMSERYKIIPIAERHSLYVSEWLSGCYDNMLSALSCTRAKDLHSPDVKEWYSSSYNNMLSASIGPHASVLSSSGLSAPATQQSRQSGRDSSTSSFLDASTPFQISSVTAEAMEGIAAEFTRRRDRERYSDLSTVQKESRLQRMREYSSRKRRGACISANVESLTSSATPRDPYDNVYHNMLEGHNVLKLVPDCEFCCAKRFEYESKGFCCKAGKIKIVTPDVPDELRRLFTTEDEDAKYFREHIRHFNSHFSFTSLGVTLDQRYCNSRSGVYTFRAQGQLYHRLDSLVPSDHGPRHLQLYFYDTDAYLAHRVERSPNLDINLIRKLLRILAANPYVQTFRSIGSVPNIDEYKISLNTCITLDQRRYNAPTAPQVAAIWVEGNDPQNCFDRSVLVYGRQDRPQYIKAYHGCYDPLSYPLFFPGGEVGWNRFMPYDDYVRLPDDIVIPYAPNELSINKLIDDIFPSLEHNTSSPSYMSARAILATKNEYVDELNAKMIDKFPGQEKIYYSFDSVEEDPHNLYPNEFLNSLTPNGLPPHVLKVKVNCPVILLRNLNPNNGLCNGTRLMVRAFQDNAIDAEIVGGQHIGKRVFIPRIPLSPSEDLSLPFKFKRKQFPIRLSFAMTVNKAQGQTIPNVGIYLPEPVFSHGQLYVALSRGVSRETTRILAKPRTDINPTGKNTKNIVYRDVLV